MRMNNIHQAAPGAVLWSTQAAVQYQETVFIIISTQFKTINQKEMTKEQFS
jgi:hypothetical protein